MNSNAIHNELIQIRDKQRSLESDLKKHSNNIQSLFTKISPQVESKIEAPPVTKPVAVVIPKKRETEKKSPPAPVTIP